MERRVSIVWQPLTPSIAPVRSLLRIDEAAAESLSCSGDCGWMNNAEERRGPDWNTQDGTGNGWRSFSGGSNLFLDSWNGQLINGVWDVGGWIRGKKAARNSLLPNFIIVCLSRFALWIFDYILKLETLSPATYSALGSSSIIAFTLSVTSPSSPAAPFLSVYPMFRVTILHKSQRPFQRPIIHFIRSTRFLGSTAAYLRHLI